ncbi:phytanoyl-CoA dioxygenase family protein [Parahaliea mediterranea]|uniref:Phytanoyl-CoA dioxygenase family protein n=1 Tax=Parahaliea mediterranea TaxID=651086 RepID=A0A939INZ4_9GAMM|nr:phytanoyl-CoA dioxygenase family protein [Parahaliea mediterranea]MBN7798633.1 phytanoyl-CoA dioxygenase family protein [Parahaliea mediterranea]
MSRKNVSEYLSADLAGTYRRTESEAAKMLPPEVVDADLAAVAEHGYVVIEKLLTDRELDDIRGAAAPLLREAGRNEFEGLKTQRVYAVLAKTRALDRLVDHPRILALLDRLFQPNYLLSQLQIINILPGETAQALHADDSFYPLPRPRPPLGAATVWAIDDFTASNGATSIVPGSHAWGDDRSPGTGEARPAVMPAGSVIFYPGTFWHGGGANRSDNARLAVTCQYCEPWLRTQENYFLGTPLEVVREVSEDIRRMLGYSIHPPFIGMVNGMHPKRVLEDG